jgi:hypothetical protein
MGYQAALDKAWKALETAGLRNKEPVRFFSEEYTVDADRRSVLSASGFPAKDFVSVLVLHYLIQKLAGLPQLNGEWISFKELDGGEQYYPAFRKRSIDILLKKFAGNVETLGKSAQADAGTVLEAFPGVPLQVLMWKSDEEFAAEATILFDRCISRIFSTEDIAVLAGFVPKYV